MANGPEFTIFFCISRGSGQQYVYQILLFHVHHYGTLFVEHPMRL